MEETSTRRKEIYTGLFGIIFFFGGFLVGELGLRIINEIRFGASETLGEIEHIKTIEPTESKKQGFFTDDSQLRRPYPNQLLGNVRINNHGFRGPDIPKEKPDNTLRIAFLGSSTTYDAAVPEGENWPAQVIKILRSKVSNCNIDFVNAGLPGFSTPNMETYWREVVNEYNPDVVVALPGDMTPNLQKAARVAGFEPQRLTDNWLTKNSVLWSLITKNAEVVRLQRSAFSEENKFQPNTIQLTNDFRSNLSKLISSILASDIFLAVPTIASHVRDNLSEDEQLIAADSALFYLPFISIPTLIMIQDAYNEALQAEVNQHPEVLLIDGDELIPADNNHFIDSRHFAPRGSEIMGKRIADSLFLSVEFHDFLRQRVPCKWQDSSQMR